MGTKLVPRGALSGQAQAAAMAAPVMLNGAPGQMPEFKTRIEPTRVRITGAGFFDAGAFNNYLTTGDKTKFPRPVGQARDFYGLDKLFHDAPKHRWQVAAHKVAAHKAK